MQYLLIAKIEKIQSIYTVTGIPVTKSEEYHHVRSIRLTDSVWETLGAAASERGITRADLIEQLVEEGVIGSAPSLRKTGDEIEQLIDQVLADPVVTRKGKDRGAVRRAVETLLNLLGY